MTDIGGQPPQPPPAPVAPIEAPVLPPVVPVIPVPTPAKGIPWGQIGKAVEWAVVGAVTTFLGAVSQFSGGVWDSKHLAAAGVGALTGFVGQLSAVLAQLRSS